MWKIQLLYIFCFLSSFFLLCLSLYVIYSARKNQLVGRKGLPNVSNSDSDLARHRISLADNRDRSKEKKSPSLSNLTNQEGNSKYKVSRQSHLENTFTLSYSSIIAVLVVLYTIPQMYTHLLLETEKEYTKNAWCLEKPGHFHQNTCFQKKCTHQFSFEYHTKHIIYFWLIFCILLTWILLSTFPLFSNYNIQWNFHLETFCSRKILFEHISIVL